MRTNSADLTSRCGRASMGAWLMALLAGATASWPGGATAGRATDASACAGCHASAWGKAPSAHAALSKRECRACHEPGTGPATCKGAQRAWRTTPASDRVCAECHKPKSPEGRPAHTAYATGACSGCHDPHGNGQPRSVVAEGGALCARCHGKDGSGAKTHISAKEKGSHAALRTSGCEGCHESGHHAERPKLLKAPVGELCAGCHDPDPDVKHAPVKSGACTGCHDPHGPGAYPKLLRAKGVELCLRCHGADGATGAPLAEARLVLKRASVHLPIREGRCDDCHVKGHGGAAEKLLVKAVPELCAGCHPKAGKEPNTHAPVAGGECLSCHSPHSGDAKPLLAKSREQVCATCHKKKALLTKAFAHAPVVEGRCLDCHRGHGSEKARLLVETGKALCLRCHDAAKKVPGAPRGSARLDLTLANTHAALKACKSCHAQGHDADLPKLLLKRPAELCADCHDRKDQAPYTHGAVRLGDCTGCHSPHASAHANLLVEGNETALCFRCHTDDVSRRASVHPPITQKKCGACHDPHGSQHLFALKAGRGKDACGGCHKPVDVGKVRHAVIDRQGCTGCHDAHGGGSANLLPKPINELCASCHEEQKDGLHVSNLRADGHKVSGGRDPRKPEREFSCISCHDPHGSDNPKLFYFGADAMESCDACHGNMSGKNPGAKDIARLNRPELQGRPQPTEGGGGP